LAKVFTTCISSFAFVSLPAARVPSADLVGSFVLLLVECVFLAERAYRSNNKGRPKAPRSVAERQYVVGDYPDLALSLDAARGPAASADA
jgi:hypothetical protein